MASSNHSGPVVHMGQGRMAEEGDKGVRGMSRRQEHNMWSEESRGQQRGARGQQFKPEWTVTLAERRRRENDVENQHQNGGWEDQGGSEKPGNETARSPAHWMRQPVVNDRVGKRETKCWSPLQEDVGCLSGPARCGGLRLRVCARTGCECRKESQHVARRMRSLR